MDLRSTLRVAFRALARNKMRSALTMLGVIIGIAAFIAMVSVAEGVANPEASGRMGTRQIWLLPHSQSLPARPHRSAALRIKRENETSLWFQVAGVRFLVPIFCFLCSIFCFLFSDLYVRFCAPWP